MISQLDYTGQPRNTVMQRVLWTGISRDAVTLPKPWVCFPPLFIPPVLLQPNLQRKTWSLLSNFKERNSQH